MKPRLVSVIGLVAVVLSGHSIWGAETAETNTADKVHRVVMHLNSANEKVQLGALNNIRHLYQALGREHLQLELVVHGDGLVLLTRKATAMGPALAELRKEYGVRYTACSNTMKAMKLTREDLIDEVGETVPAMERLMERQEQGWAYIKP
jgi:hypothetical protein